MHTMGHRVVELEPIHGFAAETTAATVLIGTAHFGMPVSTTHVISSAIMGVGSSTRRQGRPLGRRPQHPPRLGRHDPGAATIAALAWFVLNSLGVGSIGRPPRADSDTWRHLP